MLKLQVIGNLGADAERGSSQGQNYVKFRVAHTDRFTKADGTVVDNTTWVNCIWSGDHDSILPYMRQGVRLYVDGEASTRVYSSAKERCMKAGLDLRVRQVELVGHQPEAVPSRLYDSDGIQHDVQKYYFAESAKEKKELYDVRGAQYMVDKGWIAPTNVVKDQQEDDTQQG